MIRTVMFDYGGVVKESHPLSMSLGKICGLSDEELEKTKEKRFQIGAKATKGLISDRDFFQQFSELLGKPLPQDSVEQAQKYYRETFFVFPEVISLVKNLKARGIKVVVLSNIFKFEAEVIREKGGYDEFDELFLSCDAGTMKPEPEFYSLAIKRLGANPQECIFIDDREKNLLPAEALGIKTVLAKNSQQIVNDVLSIIDSEN